MTEKKRKGAAGVRGGTSRELAHCIDVSLAAVALRSFCLVFVFLFFFVLLFEICKRFDAN